MDFRKNTWKSIFMAASSLGQAGNRFFRHKRPLPAGSAAHCRTQHKASPPAALSGKPHLSNFTILHKLNQHIF